MTSFKSHSYKVEGLDLHPGLTPVPGIQTAAQHELAFG